ncbi:hypothetical protein CBER1_04060 [Cercospora berteroae]|uniref:Uncharacterized protein n=1 Tax=Cercospora berteroae TaxID=357750 RepID=A0A2S6C4X3_9PEZI|nr:hypothetical protein CBER1_04060 [Cercospora berteroae]
MYGYYPQQSYHALVLWLFWIKHTFLVFGNILVVVCLMLVSTSTDGQVQATHILALVLELLNFIAEPVEMVLWSHHLLEPWLYLTLQILKALLWSCMTPFSVSQLHLYFTGIQWEHWTLVALFITTALSFYMSLGYAIFVFVRSRKRRRIGYAPEKPEGV